MFQGIEDVQLVKDVAENDLIFKVAQLNLN